MENAVENTLERPRESAALARVAVAAAAATVLARVPFLAERMWDHDSVQFALGAGHFDLAAHQPHPPGYPLYVGLIKLLGAVGLEPLQAMVALSLLAGAAGAAALVLLVGHLAGGGRNGVAAGLVAGALYASNPLLWFYGELPLVYAVEGGMTAVVAWAVERGGGSRGRFLLACLLLALAGGLRPSTLVLLAPLLLYGIWRGLRAGRLTPGVLLGGAAVGAVAVAAWLVPLLVAAGGLTAYRELSKAHFGVLLPQTSVLYGAGGAALRHNLELLVKWGAQGALPAALTLGVVGMKAPRRLAEGLRLALRRWTFLAAWGMPALLFFALFHLTKAGYTLIHLPVLLAAAALAVAPFLAAGAGDRRLWIRAVAVAALAAILGASLFMWGRDRPPGAPRWQALYRHEFNRHTLASYETDLAAALDVLGRFPPESTVLVTVELAGAGAAGSEGFLYPWQRHLQWYLPGYLVVYLAPEEALAAASRRRQAFRPLGTEIDLPPGTERLIFVLAGETGERLPLPPAETVLRNHHFLLLALPAAAEVSVGPFVLRARRGEPAAREAGPDSGPGSGPGSRVPETSGSQAASTPSSSGTASHSTI